MSPTTCLFFDVAWLINDASENMGCLPKNNPPCEVHRSSEFVTEVLVHPVFTLRYFNLYMFKYMRYNGKNYHCCSPRTGVILRNRDFTHTHSRHVSSSALRIQYGSTEAHTVGRWLINTEARVQSQVTSWEIRGGRSGIGARYFPISSIFPY
jgi:hypothetical protein